MAYLIVSSLPYGASVCASVRELDGYAYPVHAPVGVDTTVDPDQLRAAVVASGILLEWQDGREDAGCTNQGCRIIEITDDEERALRDAVAAMARVDSAVRERRSDAVATLGAVPADAKAERSAAQAKVSARARVVNEGGDGYVPFVSWDSAAGRDIAARHGLDGAELAKAEAIVSEWR